MADIVNIASDVKVKVIESNVREELPIKAHTVYRVSWLVNCTRKEEFFTVRPWAEQFVRKLIDAAELVRIDIRPLVGEVVVKDE